MSVPPNSQITYCDGHRREQRTLRTRLEPVLAEEKWLRGTDGGGGSLELEAGWGLRLLWRTTSLGWLSFAHAGLRHYFLLLLESEESRADETLVIHDPFISNGHYRLSTLLRISTVVLTD
jgi:hypothetical protein